MARPPKDLTKPIPYFPGVPPTANSSQAEVVRAVWDELRRIAEAVNNPPKS